MHIILPFALTVGGLGAPVPVPAGAPAEGRTLGASDMSAGDRLGLLGAEDGVNFQPIMRPGTHPPEQLILTQYDAEITITNSCEAYRTIRLDVDPASTLSKVAMSFQEGASPDVAIFGDGSSGPLIVTLPGTLFDGPLAVAARNCRSFTILTAASLIIPPDLDCVIRATEKIDIEGPVNGSANQTLFNNVIGIVRDVGSTMGGAGGGGAGGGAGAAGNGSAGATGGDPSGFDTVAGNAGPDWTVGAQSAPGLGGNGGIGGVGADGNPGLAGVTGTVNPNFVSALQTYPAGPAGSMFASVAGPDGGIGGNGGNGSAGAAGGAGGASGRGGKGASCITFVAPQIILAALVSANGQDATDGAAGGAGAAAPLASNEGGGGGGSGGGGGGGGAGGLVNLYFGSGGLTETVTPQVLGGLGGLGGGGGAAGAGDGAGFAGGTGKAGAPGQAGSPGLVTRAKIA